MAAHTTATMAEAQAARDKLRERENELARLSEQIVRERRELPWVRVDKQYTFDTDDGPKTLAERPGGQLPRQDLPGRGRGGAGGRPVDCGGAAAGHLVAGVVATGVGDRVRDLGPVDLAADRPGRVCLPVVGAAACTPCDTRVCRLVRRHLV